jgi:hypothetical protein
MDMFDFIMVFSHKILSINQSLTVLNLCYRVLYFFYFF